MQETPRRLWVTIAYIGLALVVLALLVIALVMIDKTHFGFLVRTIFIEVITSGVVIGSLVVLIAAIMLPGKATWRGIVLLLFGIIGLTSPLFGLLFLFPWAVLVLMVPLMFVSLSRYKQLAL